MLYTDYCGNINRVTAKQRKQKQLNLCLPVERKFMIPYFFNNFQRKKFVHILLKIENLNS